jgi:hypothetical protein
MKNELDLWEVGLAEQMKGKEFSFDPQAYADFENLLQAESFGQKKGEQAPRDVDRMQTAGGTSIGFTLPVIFVFLGLACFAGWWFWPQSEASPGSVQTITVPQTELPASAPGPSTFIAPAAAPTSSAITETNASSPLRDAAIDLPSTANTAPVDEAVQLLDTQENINEAATPALPRSTYQVTYLPALRPITSVRALEAKSISLPEVQKPTPPSPKRDRKALFPDIINKQQ